MDVPYGRLEGVPCRRYDFTLSQHPLYSECNFFAVEITQHSTHFLFISNTFTSNARLKLAKNQAIAKQQPEAELLLTEKYSHSSCENKRAKEHVCLNS